MEAKPKMPVGDEIRFQAPDRHRQEEAYGKSSLKDESYETRRAFDDIYHYWQDIETPGFDDWQHKNPYDGWGDYAKFDAQFRKPFKLDSVDTLYIQPIVWDQSHHSAINDDLLANVKYWLEAFY